MKHRFLLSLHVSDQPTLLASLGTVPVLMRRTSGVVLTLLLMLACCGVAAAAEDYAASEFLTEGVQSEMTSADILTLLNQTVGAGAASGVNPPVAHPLRRGFSVTALPRHSNIILRFRVDQSDTTPRYRMAEVAISADLGSQFFELVKAALASAESVFSTDHFAQPWELGLNAESDSGGQITVKVQGDAAAHFTLSWQVNSPKRPIDSFMVPTAFGSERAGTEYISAVVHFPITLQEFQFLSNIYGVGQRFHDFPLYPHTWLHLTVTDGATNRFVTVHFDAITTKGQRLFVAEAPASIDVGGRFLAETVRRMQEMLDEEAAKPGSSGKWQTEFPYEDPEYGVVIAAVAGERGLFDITYRLQTAAQSVKPHGESADH